MRKIFEFLDKWGVRVMIIPVLITFLKTCSTNGRIERLEKQVTSMEVKTEKSVDSLSFELKKEIKIEGLESERRMIQSTNREMMDVRRQEKIGEIIDSLKRSK
jgi:hypothetical protein